MEDVVSRIREWATSSVFLRALFLGFLILLLQIPILYIEELTCEREQTRAFAVSDVTGIWGGAQTLTGPVLVVPYRYQGMHEQGWATTETRYAHFLPDQLDIRAVMTTELRRRGIFEVPLYRANLQITGAFSGPDFSDWEIDPDDILWNRATFAVGISEPRGIQEPVALELDGQEIAFRPGKGETSTFCAGIHAPLTELNPANFSEGFSFSFSLFLNGSDRLMFQPSGKVTEVRLESDWPHPSFTGGYLPKSSVVKDGIAATAVVGLVSVYCFQILGHRAWSLSAVLFAFYGFLFMLLSLEDYSLLIGSVGLFAILAAVMFLTRRIDWWRITASGQYDNQPVIR